MLPSFSEPNSPKGLNIWVYTVYTMQITRTVQQIGNGAHVYLPKEMTGKKVVVSLARKSMEEIETEILMILKKHLRHISGVYLYGSYARGEETPESDIDVLVISDVDIKKRVGGYDIISASQEQVEKTIENNAVLLLPILKEAKPILNEAWLDRPSKQRLTKRNTQWYIETTESSLKLAEDWIRERDTKVIDSIVYPLIMRLRGLILIGSLLHDKKYSHKQVLEHLIKGDISPDKANQLYRMYKEHRDTRPVSKNSLDYDDISMLYRVVYRHFCRIRSLWEKLT